MLLAIVSALLLTSSPHAKIAVTPPQPVVHQVVKLDATGSTCGKHTPCSYKWTGIGSGKVRYTAFDAVGKQSIQLRVYNHQGKLVVTKRQTVTVLKAAPPVTTPPSTPPPVTTPPSTPPPVTTPPSTPPPVTTPPSGGKLRWPAPALTNPTTIKLAVGETKTTLDDAKDYIIKLPSTTTGAVTLTGGHNVVIKGGSIHLPTSSTSQRGIYIKNNQGTVHIEGVSIDNTDGADSDGIAIVSPNSTVQIENTRITGIHGQQSGWHADDVQPWGGVKALRIDHLTGHSNYQGLFLRPDQGPIGSIDISNVNLYYDNVGAKTGGYLVWLTTGCNTAPTTLSNVYISQLRSGATLGKSVWPDVQDGSCPAAVSGAFAAWPKLPVSGGVTFDPSVSDYVPAGVAGVGYDG